MNWWCTSFQNLTVIKLGEWCCTQKRSNSKNKYTITFKKNTEIRFTTYEKHGKNCVNILENKEYELCTHHFVLIQSLVQLLYKMYGYNTSEGWNYGMYSFPSEIIGIYLNSAIAGFSLELLLYQNKQYNIVSSRLLVSFLQLLFRCYYLVPILLSQNFSIW